MNEASLEPAYELPPLPANLDDWHATLRLYRNPRFLRDRADEIDRRNGDGPALTSAQARSLIDSTVEIWSNDEASASEGVAPDWLGTVADVVSIGDKWHFVIKED